MRMLIRRGWIGALLLAAAAGAVCVTGCSKTSVRATASEAPGAFTDARDGQTYRTEVIGGARWMAENLNYKIGNSWCYDNDSSKCKRYGRLYDFETAQMACPHGWHLSTDEDWHDLVAATGGDADDDTRLKTTAGWDVRPEDCDDAGCPEPTPGTDEFGFSALPGGYRCCGGRFGGAGHIGHWWVMPESDCDKISSMSIAYRNGAAEEKRDYGIDDGYSVRCVQDGRGDKCKRRMFAFLKQRAEDEEAGAAEEAEKRNEGLEERIEELSEYFTDSRDGKVYRTVKIGGATWMAENLNYNPRAGKSWCAGNSKRLCARYGKLYDWETAKDICPEGWHLPSRREWGGLGEAAGGERSETEDAYILWVGAGDRLKSKSGWGDYHGGTDDYGFSALPGGYYNRSTGAFFVGDYGEWWTATASGDSAAFYRSVNGYNDRLDEADYEKVNGCYVRCVQD